MPERRRARRPGRLAAASVAGLLALCLDAPDARAELGAVWAVDDGTKVKADALAHPLARGNGIFRARPARVSLFGARNEIVAFQLIIAGGAQPTSKVSVSLPAIGPIANAEPSDDPERYFVGRPIERLLQHYHDVKQRSQTLVWQPGSAAEPANLLGPLPDALSPLGERAFTVAARRNQGVWIDVYIPKDTPPGLHRGTLEVRVDGAPCALAACRIAVELKVLSQTLPDRPTARAMVAFSGSDDDRDQMAARYFKKPWDADDEAVEALRARHFKLARRHRLTAFIGHDKAPTEPLARRISGAAFTPAAGYAGPGQGVGQALYSIHTYGTAKLEPAAARSWSDWFASHGPEATYFYYVIDEPGSDDVAEANRLARAARPVPSFVTHVFTPALEMDIFAAPAQSFSPADAGRARAAGKRYWIYNGVRPFSGTLMIDDVAIAPRVNPWIQFKHGIEWWFYWEATYYNDVQGKRGQVDVWNDPANYGNADGDRLNGDGLLFYPGRDALFPNSDHGFDGPLPSIRLKNWRRGIQDVEYLVLARAAGHGAFVERLLATLLPRTLADETAAGAPVCWPDDGERWLAARRLLADLLEHGRAPEIPAQLAVPPEPWWPRTVRSAWAAANRFGKKKLALLAAAGLSGLIVIVVWLRRRHRNRKRAANG